MTAADGFAEILAACRAVPGLTAHGGDDVGNLSLPAVTVGAPVLTWDTYSDVPRATFPVTVLVRLGPGAILSLLEFTPAVAAAVEGVRGATVGSASPASYDLGGGVVAAAYELSVEYPT